MAADQLMQDREQAFGVLLLESAQVWLNVFMHGNEAVVCIANCPVHTHLGLAAIGVQVCYLRLRCHKFALRAAFVWQGIPV